MNDPIQAYTDFKQSVFRYITTAFHTRSESFETDRYALLDEDGGLFQKMFIEPLVPYQGSVPIGQLTQADLPGMSKEACAAFRAVCGANLFAGGHPLYTHQRDMLAQSLSGKHCVVTTGTGSGKTEAFLLPLIASLVREAATWARARSLAARPADWWRSNGTRWSADKRSKCWGERRTPALRAVILYPMNALVEDQLSRLREALDSDEVHAAYASEDAYFKGNRITFARFNSQTPVSGHPVRPNGDSNTSARSRLRTELSEAKATYEQLRDQWQLAAPGTAKEDAKELLSFFPRVDDLSVEMIHRWEMQRIPPDIFITNFSMLSVMLMRHQDSNIEGDQADADMIEKTRVWLDGDPCHDDPALPPTRLFHLVVDELHLYRGTAGTEVAYLLRLLLHRLGLGPNSPQLRILASSASLESCCFGKGA